MSVALCSHRIRYALALAVATALVLTAAPAFAEPASDSGGSDVTAAGSASAVETAAAPHSDAYSQALATKQARVDEFQAQLDALDRELEIASQEYNAAVDRLAELQNKVQVAQMDLENARQAYETQSLILSQRATSNYKDGAASAFEMLLDSKSMADFISRVKFLNTIGLADADLAASLKGQKESMEKQVADLQAAKTEAEALEFEMKARRIEVTIRISEREQMFADAQSDLVALLDNAAGRASSDDAALLADVLSGAGKSGIIADPGTPVETAFAYHGVKYVWAGDDPTGFDCSGLMLYVFKQHGVTLPHYSGSQFLLGQKVAYDALAPGDAVFFGNPIHHVGMYIGGGYFLHAPKTGDYVKISRLADRKDFAGARRYPWEYRVGPPLNAVSSTTEALDQVP